MEGQGDFCEAGCFGWGEQFLKQDFGIFLGGRLLSANSRPSEAPRIGASIAKPPESLDFDSYN